MKDMYENFSEVYDLFLGDYDGYDWCIQFIEATIQEYGQNPKALLELACGTGNILQNFAGKYEVSGLDISASMLKQAKEKLPDVPFYEMNMAGFQLNRRYDIILCMFDSINHLLKYQGWISTFTSARDHLNPGGIFIFDMNTSERLDHLSQATGVIQQKNDAYLVMKVTKTADNITNWNLKIFKGVRDNLYELSEDNIEEASFSPQKVKKDLETLFGKVRIRTFEDGPNMVRGRVFFVCQV